MGCYCSATNFPPCGWCESHFLCDKCDDYVLNDDAQEWNNLLLCPDCYDGEKEEYTKVTNSTIYQKLFGRNK